MTNKEFGEWLLGRLRRREWNLSDLARAMDRSPSMVSRWSRGERLPDPRSCDLLADALGLDRDEVLARAGHRPEADPIPMGDPRRELHALIDKITWTDETATRMVSGMLEKLREDQVKARGRRR